MGVWHFSFRYGTFLADMAQTSQQSIVCWKLTYLAATFISVIFYHFICRFCNVHRPKRIFLFYLQGVLFLPIICFSNQFIHTTHYIYNSIHYHQATWLFFVWCVIFVGIALSTFVELYNVMKKIKGIEHIQTVYLFGGWLSVG